MDNPNVIKYSDLVQPDSAITDLIEQLDALIGKYTEAQGKIQSQAAATAKSMQGLSGATDDQRKSITLSMEASEKLLAEYRAVDDELTRTKRAQAEVNAVNREYTQIAKLVTTLNTAKEGSYNRLSAQYRLNKIALDKMSEAERSGTEYGRKLEAETKAIYERMNQLQKATGKAQLQVGQYERALGGALGVNSRWVSMLTDTNGAMNTLKGMFSALKGPIGIALAAIGALTGAFKLFKESIHATQSTGDTFDREMAGWRSTWELFQKAVSTFDFGIFIRGAREAYRAGKDLQAVLDEAFERGNSVRLQRAKMSKDISDLEETMRDTTKTIDERLEAAQKYREKITPIYEQEIESAKRVRDTQLDNLFKQTQGRRKLTEEEKKAGKERLTQFIQDYNLNEDLIDQAREYNQARGNLAQREKGYGLQLSAEDLRESQKIVNTASEGVKAFADIVRQYDLTNDKQVKAYVDAEEAYGRSQAALYQENKRVFNTEKSLAAERIRNAKEEADRKEAIRKEKQAKQDEADAKEAARKEKEEADEIARQRNILNASLQSTQLQIAVTQEGTEEMLALRLEMVEKQRAIEIFENKQKAETLRQNEAAINAKYDALALREHAKYNVQMAQRDLAAEQDLAAQEFALLDRNERQKTLFRLQQEQERLESILKINEMAAEKMTEQEVAGIQATIAAIKKEIGTTGYSNIYEVLGISLSGQQQGALNTALGSIKDSLGQVADAWERSAEAAVRAADAQVSAAKEALDAQIEAREAGYANSVDTAQKELALAQRQREEAARQQAAAQRAQLAMDTVTQASSLITASANLWKLFSALNPGLAIAAIATMWGSFAAAKIKAVQMTSQSEQYGEGTVELLEGGSHASGHDIDLGRKKDGTRRRAEGGEFFAVINKRSSRKFRSIIPDVINSFNDGTFAERYQRATAAAAGYAVSVGTDVSGLERDVAAIRRQGDSSQYVDAKGNIVIRYKNLTRKIKS